MAKRRKLVLWTGVGAALAAAIGVLGILHALEPDPAAIKAEFEAKIAELEAMTVQDAVRRDAIAEELLAVEDYRKYARSLWLKLERLRPKYHEAAVLDRAALKAVTPFLARCRDLTTVPAAELGTLNDEGRAHLGNYAATRFAPSLQETLDRIVRRVREFPELCSRGGMSPEEAFVDLHRKVRVDAEAGRYAEALGRIAEYEKLRLDPLLTTKARELREYVERRRLRPR